MAEMELGQIAVNVRFRPIPAISKVSACTHCRHAGLLANLSRMKAIRGAALIGLIAAWLVFIFAGFRSNAMLRDAQYAPSSYCQSRPHDFQMVDMKRPACVESGAAKRWNDNQRLLTTAGAIGGALFIALFAEQWLSRRRKTTS
jgi:hypothetical protein